MSTSRRQILAGLAGLPLMLGSQAAWAGAANPKGKQPLASEPASVVIIGAGLAGLQAALLLQQAGIKVVVLEGAKRVGGRVYTASWLENAPEFGASQIGRSYARVIDLCRQYNLKLIPEDRNLLTMASHVRGQWVNAADWAGSTANRMVGDERSIQPALVGSQLMGRYNRLGSG